MTEAVQERKVVKLGDYTLTGKIGRGGVAEIYKGRQESLDRDVAIKILSPDLTTDPDIVRRFERESMVIAKLNHPNIVHVIDRGITGGRYYFVMDYVDGASFREVIDSERIPLTTKLETIVQVCKALDYAHKNGVIHRDIKPSNILIDRLGNALVADFGIAQIIGLPESEMTSSDVILGTVSYMSPEQKVSSTNVDQTTDIYAVGVILYEILAGKKPLGHFKPPSEINPAINAKLDEIVLKCLAQEPMERYQSAVELKDALLEALNSETPAGTSADPSAAGVDSFIGKCRYLDTIKETQFGSSVLVENRVNKRLYVIKKHNKGNVGRKEARLLATLKHKNIVTIHGAGGDQKSTAIVSEYAQGGSLSDRMARRYEWRKAMDIIVQVATGLDFAHKNNIVHGNLRPSNILFDASEFVKLCDFGFPSHYEETAKKNWYLPPERRASRQGDIYALGVILHQMLTGRNPSYDQNDKLRLDDVRMVLPEEISRMLSELLAIRVTSRYQSCSEFLQDWHNFEERASTLESEASSPPILTATPVRGVPRWVYIAAALGLTAAIMLTLYLTGVFR
ncbi:MAG TPA: protein kinase [Candidatus Deferrimicrobium sp.]|nr:protein kinase [Candidatus Deferrimicrobium sp.]